MSTDAYLVMQQRPGSGTGAVSALADADRSRIGGRAPIKLREDASKGHLNLRGNPGSRTLASELEALGLSLPEPLTANAAGKKSICWLAPDEWLLSLPAADLGAAEAQLRAALSADCAVTDVSGAYTLISVGGGKAEELLRKSSPYDFHPSAFPVGKAVATVFAQTQAIIRRTAETQFELLVRRSYARYAWAWLRDAAAEYGLAPD